MKTTNTQKTDYFQQEFSVPISYRVYFTEDLFHPSNATLKEIVTIKNSGNPVKVIFVLDEGVVKNNLNLPEKIKSYCDNFQDYFSPISDPMILPGGEVCKNSRKYIDIVVDEINTNRICRHSYVIAIGGGAMIDAVGYASAIAHRGVRLVRIPTTVLSQNDSGVGVKNGINYFNKKNFMGTFSPPFAVVNDYNFLETLDERDWRSGIAEAIKVALIKDEEFFIFLEAASEKITKRDKPSMQHLIRRCAELHLKHISSGDAFEVGSSRPLDFGHWAAHKLEHLTEYSLRHGEAVAIGIALDCIYSNLQGLLQTSQLQQILKMISNYGFKLYIPELHSASGKEFAVLDGIEEFREHLGGQLNVMLLESIGKGKEVHNIDNELMKQAIKLLQQYEQKGVII